MAHSWRAPTEESIRYLLEDSDHRDGDALAPGSRSRLACAKSLHADFKVGSPRYSLLPRRRSLERAEGRCSPNRRLLLGREWKERRRRDSGKEGRRSGWAGETRERKGERIRRRRGKRRRSPHRLPAAVAVVSIVVLSLAERLSTRPRNTRKWEMQSRFALLCNYARNVCAAILVSETK